LCWWKFDEGYGTKVYDFMNNAPEGTITGCRWWVAPSATGKVDIPASTLQNDLKQMFNNPLSSDVQLTVEDYSGTPISAHRALLAARSEAFKAMLLNEMSEATMKTITLKEIKFDTLTLLVQYFYTDCVTITETNVVDLLIASDRFQIKRLQAMCEDYMMKNIELENVCDLFSLADRVHAAQLKTFCMNWIVSNWSEVFKKGEDIHLPCELQKEIRDIVGPVYFPSPKRRKVTPKPP
jgi:speckle-type POZ protein